MMVVGFRDRQVTVETQLRVQVRAGVWMNGRTTYYISTRFNAKESEARLSYQPSRCKAFLPDRYRDRTASRRRCTPRPAIDRRWSLYVQMLTSRSSRTRSRSSPLLFVWGRWCELRSGNVGIKNTTYWHVRRTIRSVLIAAVVHYVLGHALMGGAVISWENTLFRTF